MLPRGRAWLKLRYRDATMIKILRLSGPGMMSSANARVGRGSNAFGSPLTPLESQIWGIAARYVLGRFASPVRSVDGADSRKGRQRAVMFGTATRVSPRATLHVTNRRRDGTLSLRDEIQDLAAQLEAGPRALSRSLDQVKAGAVLFRTIQHLLGPRGRQLSSRRAWISTFSSCQAMALMSIAAADTRSRNPASASSNSSGS